VAVPDPGVENPCVKPVVGTLANINPNPNLNPRLIAADVIHVSASITNIHLAGGDNLLHATYDI
jgi:hypothetical protein